MNIFRFLIFAAGVVLSSWGALVVVSVAVRRFMRASAPLSWRWAQVGGGAMIFPSFWLGIFYLLPFGEGLFIGQFGRGVAELGALLGLAAAMFFGVLFGASLGTGLGASFHAVRNAH